MPKSRGGKEGAKSISSKILQVETSKRNEQKKLSQSTLGNVKERKNEESCS